MEKVIVPCSNTIDLGMRIAEKLNCEIASYETRKFPDNEVYFRIDSDLKNKEAILVQSGYPDPNTSLMEVLLGADSAKNKGAGKITAVFTYFPYARQDKRFKPGEAFSLEVIIKMLKSAGIKKLVMVDVHFRDAYGKFDLFGLETYNLTAGPDLARHVKQKFHVKQLHIISPDFGASKFVENTAKKTKSSYVALEKKRKSDFEVTMSGSLEVKGKNVLVLDDIISTGGTMSKAIEMAKEADAKKVFAAATHGIFAESSLPLLGRISDYVVTTDSIENPTSKVSLDKEIAKVL